MAELHPLVAGFSDVADAYERGRPGYGDEVVDALRRELALAGGARVLDLGAGTGKLSRPLLRAGLDVVAVEPLEGMRARLAREIGAERVRAGAAEALPLGDGSVDAVTAADAFHWFDHAPALAEIARVLRPGGGLALLWTVPIWRDGNAGWAGELGAMLAALRPDHPGFAGHDWAALVAGAGGFDPLRRLEVCFERRGDRDTVLAYVASVSWVANRPVGEREAVLADAAALLARHEVGPFVHPVRTELFVTRRAERPPAPSPGRPAAAS
jgi:SAM-dependent methyltransferase